MYCLINYKQSQLTMNISSQADIFCSQQSHNLADNPLCTHVPASGTCCQQCLRSTGCHVPHMCSLLGIENVGTRERKHTFLQHDTKNIRAHNLAQSKSESASTPSLLDRGSCASVVPLI